MIRGSLRVDLIKVFNNLYYLNAVTIDPSRVFIENFQVFQKVIRQAFLLPLVDYLLSTFTDKNMQIGSPSVLDNAPDETKLIGAPQVDLLFGERFLTLR